MKRLPLLFLLMLISVSTLFASKELDAKVGDFFQALKQEKYEEGITNLLAGSLLEEKVVNVTQTRNNWIAQFSQIKSLYGDYLAWDKVSTVSLGGLEETTYFVYCRDYPIKIVITEYDNGMDRKIINMFFDDQILDTLRDHGSYF
ncbi:hypothetical protein [Sediminispirochaeta smaragdinae]|jgi:hypothetical protein|uniref:DUF3887 domain-containing protein n=1 Tax=Sediminispirochaeta smaragdinae (strain DSM 11293 / JCM 15392 / SEBR 4228) TaxID=573413 RepID=E1RB07_SEDSS|nr:hypothetical protein [Sediminispirochaeta smaragdinae]ADK79537.1 hypothetical protein Spirs_0381 [Sediminispirochaeta smaragdinae DSM 11293]